MPTNAEISLVPIEPAPLIGEIHPFEMPRKMRSDDIPSRKGRLDLGGIPRRFIGASLNGVHVDRWNSCTIHHRCHICIERFDSPYQTNRSTAAIGAHQHTVPRCWT